MMTVSRLPSITVTLPLPEFVTYTRLVAGLTATPTGSFPA